MYSKKLEELARQRLSEQEKSKVKQQRKASRKKNSKPPDVVDADGWKVYNRLYPYYYSIMVWIFIVLTLAICFIMIYWIGGGAKWTLITGIALAGAFLLRWTVHWLLKIIRFSKFRSWRTNLPFQLNGWDAVWKNRGFDGYKKWYSNLVVSVETDTTSTELANAIKNSFIVFTAEANKCFYAPNFVQAGFVGDIRKKWSLVNNKEAQGSANQSVVGEIYILINQHLRMLHQEFGGIRSVKISNDGNIYTVDPVEISSD